MKRRAFLKSFGSLIAAAAVAQGVVRKLLEAGPVIETKEYVFTGARDKSVDWIAQNYSGDWCFKRVYEISAWQGGVGPGEQRV